MIVFFINDKGADLVDPAMEPWKDEATLAADVSVCAKQMMSSQWLLNIRVSSRRFDNLHGCKEREQGQEEEEDRYGRQNETST